MTKLKEIPIPEGWGYDAQHWLESQGLVSYKPFIRSSDYEKARECEFLYYLERRLGVGKLLGYSKALSRGSWFHTIAQSVGLKEEDAEPQIQAVLDLRIQELSQVCDELHIIADAKKAFLDREVKDYKMARAWWYACNSVVVGKNVGTLMDFILADHYQIIGKELYVVYERLFDKRLNCISGILDLLLLHVPQNALYVLDYKTCDCDPQVRMVTCPIEQQTWQYLDLVDKIIRSPAARRKLKLPDGVRVGGMIHAAVQKPPLEFGMRDRPFREYEFTPSRGKNAGKTRIEREYTGEPDYDLYVQRCLDWYSGSGPYVNEAQHRISSPPVNMSFTDPYILKEHRDEYEARLRYLEGLASRPAMPANFLKSTHHLRQFGKVSHWAPFYLCPVKDWVGVMRMDGFVQMPRDEDIGKALLIREKELD